MVRSYLVMKVIIVKEVISCDVLPVAMFFVVTGFQKIYEYFQINFVFEENQGNGKGRGNCAFDKFSSEICPQRMQ